MAISAKVYIGDTLISGVGNFSDRFLRFNVLGEYVEVYCSDDPSLDKYLDYDKPFELVIPYIHKGKPVSLIRDMGRLAPYVSKITFLYPTEQEQYELQAQGIYIDMYVPSYTFQSFYNVRELYVPDHVNFNEYSFWGLDGLQSVSFSIERTNMRDAWGQSFDTWFSNNVRSIDIRKVDPQCPVFSQPGRGSNLFAYCHMLETITFNKEDSFDDMPWNPQTHWGWQPFYVSNNMFMNCHQLRSILFPREASVYVQSEAFIGCPNLDVSSILAVASHIEYRGFSGVATPSLVLPVHGVFNPPQLLTIDDDAFEGSHIPTITVNTNTVIVSPRSFAGTEVQNLTFISEGEVPISLNSFQGTPLSSITVLRSDGRPGTLMLYDSNSFTQSLVINATFGNFNEPLPVVSPIMHLSENCYFVSQDVLTVAGVMVLYVDSYSLIYDSQDESFGNLSTSQVQLLFLVEHDPGRPVASVISDNFERIGGEEHTIEQHGFLYSIWRRIQ